MKVEGKERKKMPIRRRETESEYFHRMRVLRWKLQRKEIAKQNGNTIHANQEAHLQADLERDAQGIF